MRFGTEGKQVKKQVTLWLAFGNRGILYTWLVQRIKYIFDDVLCAFSFLTGAKNAKPSSIVAASLVWSPAPAANAGKNTSKSCKRVSLWNQMRSKQLLTDQLSHVTFLIFQLEWLGHGMKGKKGSHATCHSIQANTSLILLGAAPVCRRYQSRSHPKPGEPLPRQAEAAEEIEPVLWKPAGNKSVTHKLILFLFTLTRCCCIFGPNVHLSKKFVLFI